MRLEVYVDGVIGDAIICYPGGAHLGAYPGSLFSAVRHVASFHTVTDDYVSLATPEGTTLTNVIAVENPSAGDFPAGVEASYGFFKFMINGVATGGATIATLYLPGPVDSYYKYGSTTDNTTPHWYEFTYDGQTGAEIIGNTVVLHFVDGLRGDDDLTADSIIVEPGGPAIVDQPPIASAADTDTATITGLNDVFAVVAEGTPDTIFDAGLFTNGSDPFIVLESVYDLSPNDPAGFWPESFGLPASDELSKLIEYAVILLKGDDGIQLLQALYQVGAPSPSEEQMDSIIDKLRRGGVNLAAATNWLDTLIAYMNMLNADYNWSDNKVVAHAVKQYILRWMGTEDEEEIVAFIKMYRESLGGG